MVQGEKTTLILYPGTILTVDPTSGTGSARVWFIGNDGKPTSDAVAVITAVTVYGPYNANKIIGVEGILGNTTLAVAVYGNENVAAGFYPQLGSDILFATTAGAPTDGTSGTGAGTHGKGSLCVDRTNGKLYINGNTKASPTWKLVTSAA